MSKGSKLHLSGHECFPIELDGLERASGRENCGTIRPSVRFLGSALRLRGGIGQSEDDRPFVVGGHLFDDCLVERLGQRGYSDKGCRFQLLHSRQKIRHMFFKNNDRGQRSNVGSGAGAKWLQVLDVICDEQLRRAAGVKWSMLLRVSVPSMPEPCLCQGHGW